VARRIRPANFAENLRYSAGVDMFFPAGIPFLAVIALVVYNARLEAQAARTSTPKQPKS